MNVSKFNYSSAIGSKHDTMHMYEVCMPLHETNGGFGTHHIVLIPMHIKLKQAKHATLASRSHFYGTRNQ